MQCRTFLSPSLWQHFSVLLSILFVLLSFLLFFFCVLCFWPLQFPFLASVVVVEFAISVALMRIILLEAVAEYETMGPPPPKNPTFYITSPYSTVSVGKSRMSEVKPKTGGHRDVCAM